MGAEGRCDGLWISGARDEALDLLDVSDGLPNGADDFD